MKNQIAPKASFLSDKKMADRHQERVLNPEFKHAVIMAFADFSMALNPLDPTAAPQIKGAKDFIDKLLNLGEDIQPKMTKTEDVLKAIET